jgi:chloramphenicol 3-O-phosphotransferase
MDAVFDTIFLNGTVGSGKSTLADALSAQETSVHAVVDLDEIRRLSPTPPGDPFTHEIELRNLRSLAANFRAAGAQRFILAGVIEDAGERPRYLDALGSSSEGSPGMFVCRLTARPEVLEARLRSRHRDDPEALAWHLARVGELAGILERSAVDDVVLDTSDAAPRDLARAIRVAAGWASAAGGDC